MIFRQERKYRIRQPSRDGAFRYKCYSHLAQKSTALFCMCQIGKSLLGWACPRKAWPSLLKKLDALSMNVHSFLGDSRRWSISPPFVSLSGEHTWRNPVDGSQASMSQHRRLHLSRCISGQQTRGHCPIMLRARIGGFSILYHTAD